MHACLNCVEYIIVENGSINTHSVSDKQVSAKVTDNDESCCKASKCVYYAVKL